MSKPVKDKISISMGVGTMLNALLLVGSSVASRHTLPILSHVHFSFNSEGVRVTGTDLEVEQRMLVPFSDSVSATAHDNAGNVLDAGAFTTPHKKLLDILKQFDADKVATISCDTATYKVSLKVSGQRSSYKLSSLSASDYPTLEFDDVKSKVLVEASSLLSLTDPVEGSMANRDVRYYLNGMNLCMSGKNLTAVSTDGHRLSINTATVLKSDGADINCIVPRESYRTMVAYLKSVTPDTQVKVAFTANHFALYTEGKTFISKQIDGKFPDYKRVIPSENDILLKVERTELLNACKRAAILANEKFRGVRVTLPEEGGNDVFKLVSTNPEQEEASEEVAITSLKGITNSFEIGLNIDYLINALTTLNESVVNLKFRDENSSVIVKGESDLLHVVMPMRL